MPFLYWEVYMEEEKMEKINFENEDILDEFYDYLLSCGLSERTVISHYNNMDTYLNLYLCYYEIIGWKDGVNCGNVDGFLSDWFIRKCCWSNVSNMNGMVSSIKKFYKYASDKGYVDKKSVKELVQFLKNRRDHYVDLVLRYEYKFLND